MVSPIARRDLVIVVTRAVLPFRHHSGGWWHSKNAALALHQAGRLTQNSPRKTCALGGISVGDKLYLSNPPSNGGPSGPPPRRDSRLGPFPPVTTGTRRGRAIGPGPLPTGPAVGSCISVRRRLSDYGIELDPTALTYLGMPNSSSCSRNNMVGNADPNAAPSNRLRKALDDEAQRKFHLSAALARIQRLCQRRLYRVARSRPPRAREAIHSSTNPRVRDRRLGTFRIISATIGTPVHRGGR